MHGGAETPPELVWGVGVATWRTGHVDIEMPLIERLVDLELDDDGTLAVTPRALPPALNLAPFHEADPVAGKRARPKLEGTLARLLEEGGGELSPFSLGLPHPERLRELHLHDGVDRRSPEGRASFLAELALYSGLARVTTGYGVGHDEALLAEMRAVLPAGCVVGEG